MERKQIANVIVPAIAIAALIALVALVLSVGGPTTEESAKTNGPDKGAKTVDTSKAAEGMSLTLPPVDAPEWKDIGDGMKIWDVVEGSGVPVAKGERVTIHYTGWLTNGTIFDSSVKRGEPAQFGLNGLIQGWQIGIPGMKPGGIRRLFIPPDLGYGVSGSGSTIPGNANLIFEVKLISAP